MQNAIYGRTMARRQPQIIAGTAARDMEGVFVPQMLRAREPDERVLSAAIINCHTTGLHIGCDQLIELAILRCTLSASRTAVLSLDAALTQHQDPGRQLQSGIAAYTGLSTQRLRGEHLDAAAVQAFLTGADCIIAHNADFHRSFFYGAGLSDCGLPWFCTMERGRGRSWRSLADLLGDEQAAMGCNRCLARCLSIAWLLGTDTALAMEVLSEVQDGISAPDAEWHALTRSNLGDGMSADEAAGRALYACLMRHTAIMQ